MPRLSILAKVIARSRSLKGAAKKRTLMFRRSMMVDMDQSRCKHFTFYAIAALQGYVGVNILTHFGREKVAA